MGDLGSTPSWAIIIFAFISLELSPPLDLLLRDSLKGKIASTSNSGLVDKQIFYELLRSGRFC